MNVFISVLDKIGSVGKRKVDAVASSAGADAIAWNAAMTAFSILMALALTGVVLRRRVGG